MYQAWLQGNENYIRDWANFVEWAAKLNNTTSDSIMRELQKCYWFKRPEE
jgi:gamma-glutamyl:cysteine ligase YbdK (ATP-grasp superfamily)